MITSLRRSHRLAINRRFQTLCGVLVPDHSSLVEFSDASFSDFMLDEQVSESVRSFIGWFAATGGMPNELENDQLVAMLGTKNSTRILQWLYFHAVSVGKTARYREIRVTKDAIYDCTNVSAVEGRLTGIPRVSRGFLDENLDLHQQCVAWSDSALGPLEYSSQSGFSKSRAVWPNSGGLLDLSRITRLATEWISRRTTSTSSRVVYYLILLLGVVVSWLLLSVFRLRGPGPKVALLPLGNIWVFETVSADAASRYITLIRSNSSSQISLMVYDLLPIHLPDNFLPIAVEHYVHQLRLMTHCKTLLTDSLHLPPIVRGALQMMGGLTIPAIVPRPLSINPKWLTSSVVKPPPELHLLQIGALETRKNHHFAIAAFSQLQIGGRRYSIVGKKRTAGRLISDLIDGVTASSGFVDFRHGLSDEDIIQLSRSVTAMVYPSIAEGYGLPILEGLAMGLPVIASDIPPHRQFGDIGGIVYFDPNSVMSLKHAMELVADPDENWKLRAAIQFDRIPANPQQWARETRLALEA